MKNYNPISILKTLASMPYADTKSGAITIDLSKGQPGIHMLGKLDFMQKSGYTVIYKSTIDDPGTVYHKRLLNKG